MTGLLTLKNTNRNNR